MAKIYLSSTFQDLVQHREAAYKALRQMRHDVVSMEDYTAASKRPLDKCLQDVAESDVYVGIFAWRYGYKPPGHAKSITELEFRKAAECGIDRLLFLVKDDAPWPASMMDTDRGDIEALRAELERDYLIKYFDSPEDLATAISVAVANLSGELRVDEEDLTDPARLRFYVRCLDRIIEESRSQIKLYRTSSAALAGVGVGSMATAAALQLLLLGGLGLVVGSVTIFPVNNMLHHRRRQALLTAYHEELQHEPPAREAVVAVRRFLRTQLKEESI